MRDLKHKGKAERIQDYQDEYSKVKYLVLLHSSRRTALLSNTVKRYSQALLERLINPPLSCSIDGKETRGPAETVQQVCI